VLESSIGRTAACWRTWWTRGRRSCVPLSSRVARRWNLGAQARGASRPASKSVDGSPRWVEWIFKIVRYKLWSGLKSWKKWPKLTFKLILGGWPKKTCLLPHSWGPVGVKFHEFVITQLLGEIENWFWAQKMRKIQVSVNDKRKILPYFILKKLLLKNCFLHHLPMNRKDNE